MSVKQQRVVEALVVVAILAILIALLLPVIQQARVHPYHMQCRNNLKQIGLAMHNYRDVHGTFPPAYIADADGRPLHSWRVLILPYVDENDLYERYRFDEPWDGPHNRQLQDSLPHVYQCARYHRGLDPKSAEGTHLGRLCNFVAVTAPQAVFDGATVNDPWDFDCDPAEQLVVAEVCQHATHWMSPVDVTPSQLLTDLRRSVHEEHTNHQGSVMFLFADGSVLRVPHNTPEDEVRAMLNVGEPAPNE